MVDIQKNRLFVISGCSGGGKSSLLAALTDAGYCTVPEMGRQIVKEQLKTKDAVTPWDNPVAFCEMLIARSIAAYHMAKSIKTPKNNVIFLVHNNNIP